MQISQISPQINSENKHILENRKLYTERSALNINYSDRNNSVNFTISKSLTYIESTYTAEGFLNVSNPSNFEDALIFPPETPLIDKNISEPDSNTSEMLEAAMEKYYELISKQVEYFLRSISEQSYKILNPTDAKIDENLQKFNNNGSAARSYAVYSRQTVIISQNITIKGNITESDYFSSEKTAERIINFALSFYDGGDRDEFAAMVKKAVMKGYNEAMKALGGFLPPEAHETIAIVNRAIDDFAKGKDISISA